MVKPLPYPKSRIPTPLPRSARPGMYSDEIWRGIGDGLHRNANGLIGMGMGLLQGKNFAQGLALAGQGFMQGNALDRDRNRSEDDERKAERERNKTIQWLERNGRQDLIDRLDAGEPMQSIWAEATRKPETASPTDDMREYAMAVQQGYQGSFQEYMLEMKRAGATNIDFNANQGNAAGFADRMANADRILSDPAMVTAMTDLGNQALKMAPLGAGNFFMSPSAQQAEQAQRDFINAALRKESGAVISESEFANARQQYFPQPGDSEQVILQKALNRQMTIAGIIRSAGPNYTPPTLGPQQQSAPIDYRTYFGGQ